MECYRGILAIRKILVLPALSLELSSGEREIIEVHESFLAFYRRLGIKSVINLEVPGEHASCSVTPLHPGGFAYDPTVLMDNGSKATTRSYAVLRQNYV